MSRKYDIDGKTPIKLNLRPKDASPSCGMHTLRIVSMVEIHCIACGNRFNRWIKTEEK